jgi:hypothetical protein
MVSYFEEDFIRGLVPDKNMRLKPVSVLLQAFVVDLKYEPPLAVLSLGPLDCCQLFARAPVPSLSEHVRRKVQTFDLCLTPGWRAGSGGVAVGAVGLGLVAVSWVSCGRFRLIYSCYSYPKQYLMYNKKWSINV